MVLENVLQKIDSEDLAVYVVWIPVLGSDTRESALRSRSVVADARAVHFWDADTSLGRAYGRELRLPNGRELAWDVYFTYPAGQRWGERVPTPHDWAHQLGMDQRSLRQGARILDSIEVLLEDG